MLVRHRIALLMGSFTLAVANAAWAHPEYRVTVMGPADSAAADMNESGVVVGTYPFSSASTHGFVNRGRGLVDLGALGGAGSNAVAINDHGAVLGNWTSASGQQRGFIYYRGTQRDIGVIPGRGTRYTDINNGGYITAVGFPTDFSSGRRSFLRAPNGTFRNIGTLPYENPTTTAIALNNRNQITGDSGPLLLPDPPLRAILWSGGVMRDLGDLGFEPNQGAAINDCGQITGSASLPVGFREQVAFLYSGGRMINIDGRPDTADRFSAGTGINNHGHVVGYSDHLSGFIYRGRRMQSLNALIDPRLGWDIRRPQAINDAGQIAATAYRKGVQHAVRLDLIRPSTLAAPQLQNGEAMQAPAKSPADAALDAAAQARETVQPVAQ